VSLLFSIFNRVLNSKLNLHSLYIVACSIACSRLILHLKESSRQAMYCNNDIPSSWKPPFGLEAGVPSLRLTVSEIRYGFGCDGATPPPEVSGSSEEIDITEGDGGEQRMISEVSIERSSLN
jgi:hypothetical protein